MRADLHSIEILVWVTLLVPPAAQGAPLRLTINEAGARATGGNLDLSASERTIDLANVQRSRAWLPANPYLSVGSQPTIAGGIGSNFGFVLSLLRATRTSHSSV